MRHKNIQNTDDYFQALGVRVVNGNWERAIIAFRRKVKDSRVLEDWRIAQEFVRPGQLRREKKLRSIMRHNKENEIAQSRY